MEVETNWQKVKVEEKEMPVFVVKPIINKKLPVIFLFQEIFGVNNHIRNVSERIAREGYIVLTPDIFHRLEERFEVGYDDESMKKAFEKNSQFDHSKFVNDMDYLLEYVKTIPNADSQKIGTIGFCLGGTLSYLITCEKDIQASVSFYGAGIPKYLHKTKNINIPILLFFGEKDNYIPNESVEKIKKTIADNEVNAEVIVYDNADHGFFCNERNNYNETSALDSWKRTKDYLRSNL